MEKRERLRIYCDGSYCHNLPGKPAFAAWSARVGKQEVFSWSGRVEAGNPLEAEFQAVYAALQWAVAQGCKEITILSDSKGVLFRLTGRSKSDSHQQWCSRILALAGRVEKVHFQWVHHRNNRRADDLCRQAARKYREKVSLDLPLA